MIYVLPTPRELRGKFLGHHRLYAYPSEPELPTGDEFVILDSGAFWLSKAGGRSGGMSQAYMHCLAEHYAKYQTSDAALVCVAPDVYGNPEQTMRQWAWWHSEGLPQVAPVIQFTQKHLDHNEVSIAIRQCAYYRAWSPEFVLVSNLCVPGIRAAQGMPLILSVVQKVLHPRWIHVFGAGWSPEDIRAWREIGPDSIDSIAYYTAAQEGQSWDGDPPDADWRVTARRNALAAQQLASGF